MKDLIAPANLNDIRRIPIARRTNLVKIDQFTTPPGDDYSFRAFMDSLSAIKHRTNAATSLAIVVDAIIEKSRAGQPVTWALGPHVIKYGLTPLIVHLMDAGCIQCILTNGAGAIHDTEIALIGETSEEMGGHISRGDFGMAKETGEFINGAAREAMETGKGFGEALGDKLIREKAPFLHASLFAQARLRNIPLTVHVALGTDIIHMHPDMDGAATGAATFTDFKRFVAVLQGFSRGGVHLNIGSTVVLPEVFVKAMTAANNLNGKPARDYITVNMDHLSEYRPLMNVVKRGSMDGGQGFEIIGRMEIMVPLLVWILSDRIHNGNN